MINSWMSGRPSFTLGSCTLEGTEVRPIAWAQLHFVGVVSSLSCQNMDHFWGGVVSSLSCQSCLQTNVHIRAHKSAPKCILFARKGVPIWQDKEETTRQKRSKFGKIRRKPPRQKTARQKGSKFGKTRRTPPRRNAIGRMQLGAVLCPLMCTKGVPT